MGSYFDNLPPGVLSCPFYVGGMFNNSHGSPCSKEHCTLWNKEENDCNFNVIAKRLKK